jgi:hypothetical protein
MLTYHLSQNIYFGGKILVDQYAMERLSKIVSPASLVTPAYLAASAKDFDHDA